MRVQTSALNLEEWERELQKPFRVFFCTPIQLIRAIPPKLGNYDGHTGSNTDSTYG